jgi:hypothetical protein
MKGKMIGLYGNEIELLETHGPPAFLGFSNCNKLFVMEHIQAAQALKCNCYVGSQFPVIPGLSYEATKQRNVDFDKQVNGNSKHCPGDGICAPGGKRSRKEWCNECDKIV